MWRDTTVASGSSELDDKLLYNKQLCAASPQHVLQGARGGEKEEKERGVNCGGGSLPPNR